MHAGNVFGNIFDAGGIFDRQAVRLGLQAGFVNQDAGIGVQSSKCEARVVVDQGNLRGRNAGILEFEGRALFTTEDNDFLAFNTDGACSWRKSISNYF